MITSNLKLISKRFRLGRQEDSHEFLRTFLDNLQQAYAGYNPKNLSQNQDKNMIYQIFGGKMKSQVTCQNCKYPSEILEKFCDISLDVKNFDSIKHSLHSYFKKEFLSGSNKYKCSKCQIPVNATKQFLIDQRPRILTLHLKRFTNSLSKINKFVEFPQQLNIKNYCENQNIDQNYIYDLYGVLVHQGSVCWSGHYFCYVKIESSNTWYMMNDEYVKPYRFDQISKEKAYILLYKQRKYKTSQTQESNKTQQIEQKINIEITLNQQALKVNCQAHKSTPDQQHHTDKEKSFKQKENTKIYPLQNNIQSNQITQESENSIKLNKESILKNQQSMKEQQQKHDQINFHEKKISPIQKSIKEESCLDTLQDIKIIEQQPELYTQNQNNIDSQESDEFSDESDEEFIYQSDNQDSSDDLDEELDDNDQSYNDNSKQTVQKSSSRHGTHQNYEESIRKIINSSFNDEDFFFYDGNGFKNVTRGKRTKKLAYLRWLDRVIKKKVKRATDSIELNEKNINTEMQVQKDEKNQVDLEAMGNHYEKKQFQISILKGEQNNCEELEDFLFNGSEKQHCNMGEQNSQKISSKNDQKEIKLFQKAKKLIKFEDKLQQLNGKLLKPNNQLAAFC